MKTNRGTPWAPGGLPEPLPSPASVAGRRAGRGVASGWLPIVGLLAWLVLGPPLKAAEATLAWDAPTANTDGTPLTTLAGYKVHYGVASQVYSTVIDVGLATSATLTNLPTGLTTFFVVTCYNEAGIESSFSEEMAWTHPASVAPVMLTPYLSNGLGGASIVIPWSSVEGAYYAVERSTNLMSVSAFTTIASNVPSQGPMTGFTDTTATGIGAYYYRIRVER